MARRSRIRRKAKRRNPAVRHSSGPAAQLQAKEGSGGLLIGGAMDPAEKAADTLAAKALGGGGRSTVATPPKSAAAPVQRDTANSGGAVSVAPGSRAAPASASAEGAISAMGSGRAMSEAERGFFEPKFNRDFSHVRIHEGPAAQDAAQSIDASAFTMGSDIAFGVEGRTTGTFAHELAHVSLSSASPKTVKRTPKDSAVDAASAAVGSAATKAAVPAQAAGAVSLAANAVGKAAAAAALTEKQRESAQKYNERRFEDPFSYTLARKTMGINKWPGVPDKDFLDATIKWQQKHGLKVDGKFGPETTKTVVDVLTAGGDAALAKTLQEDNYVKVKEVNAPNFSVGGPAANGGFRWDVGFETSLRNGHIVQQIDSVWNEFNSSSPQTLTPRYWETWKVNGSGKVSPSVGAINDMWGRLCRAGSNGNWSMKGTLYTVLTLPSIFHGKGHAKHPPEAHDLKGTTDRPPMEKLGHKEGYLVTSVDESSRKIGGEWDFRSAASGGPVAPFHRRK